MTWTAKVACMGAIGNPYRMKGRDHLGGINVNGMIILEWVLKK
jgi:hypothetical protein